MSNIYAGDNGTVFEFTVRDNGIVVPLDGTSVQIVIKSGILRLTKTVVITDSTNGKCQIELTSEDIANPGGYVLQGIVTLPNGNQFASDPDKFPVKPRI